ncbi:hypothetical protein AAP_00061 [Ascosphaera apis ARSEF 7405]|uniref:Uncharacterized protein n=1 Tax=Ascosphaera apis ARSEF 7405 TaxID=392613 RepID=A0A166PME5_9EURO|nr:hypothetical protein AAP_00061 [Ascosphaera apis ARSEF 7405]
MAEKEAAEKEKAEAAEKKKAEAAKKEKAEAAEKKKAEAAEKKRQKAKAAEERKQEAAEKKRQKAEAAEKLKQEAEARKRRQEAERVAANTKKHREEAEKKAAENKKRKEEAEIEKRRRLAESKKADERRRQESEEREAKRQRKEPQAERGVMSTYEDDSGLGLGHLSDIDFVSDSMDDMNRIDSSEDDMGDMDLSDDNMELMSSSMKDFGINDIQVPLKKKRRTRHRVPGAMGSMMEEKRIENKVRTAIKWFYITHFNTDDIRECVEQAVPEIVDDAYRMDAYEVDSMKYLNGCKCETHVRMQKYVKMQCSLSRERTGTNIEIVDRSDALFKLFDECFDPGDFNYVFYWVKTIVDYERCSKVGRWFLRSVFVNLAVRTKIYLDKVARNDPEAAEMKSRMLMSWNRTMSRYEDIRESDFAPRKRKVKKQQQKGVDEWEIERRLQEFDSTLIVSNRPARE